MKNLFVRICCSKENILRGIIGFMLVATVFDMGGGLGIKYISYFIGLFSLFFINGFSYNKYHLIGVLGLFVLFPVIFMIKGYVAEMNLGLAINQITPFLPAVIFFFLLNEDNIDNAFNIYFKSLFLLSVITVFLCGIIFIGSNIPLVADGISFLNAKGLGFFGLRSVGSFIVPAVYFKPTLYLTGALLYFLYYSKPWAALIILAAILMAISKSSLAIVAIILFIYFVGKMRFISDYRLIISKSHLYLIFIGTIVFISFLVIFSSFWQVFWDYCWEAFSGKAATATIRFGHFHSLIQFWKENPLALLLGQGSGTSYYSLGVGEWVNNIEIDHFNTIRKFGLIWSGLFYGFILMTFIFLIRNKKNIVLGYSLLVTFILVGTNPLLINPLFLMFLIMCYKKVILS